MIDSRLPIPFIHSCASARSPSLPLPPPPTTETDHSCSSLATLSFLPLPILLTTLQSTLTRYITLASFGNSCPSSYYLFLGKHRCLNLNVYPHQEPPPTGHGAPQITHLVNTPRPQSGIPQFINPDLDLRGQGRPSLLELAILVPSV